MSEELAQAVETARISYEQSAKRLQEMDAKFGADLSTLRSLNLPNSSDGSLQKTIIEIRSEQRRQAAEVDLAKKQQEMLIKSYQDPAQYLVTSSDLLKMQPRLEQLVAGLSKSQLELAKVNGRYTENTRRLKAPSGQSLISKSRFSRKSRLPFTPWGRISNLARIEFRNWSTQKTNLKNDSVNSQVLVSNTTNWNRRSPRKVKCSVRRDRIWCKFNRLANPRSTC